MLPKQYVAAVLSVYVCLPGRGSKGRGADVDVQRAIEGSVNKGREGGVTK